MQLGSVCTCLGRAWPHPKMSTIFCPINLSNEFSPCNLDFPWKSDLKMLKMNRKFSGHFDVPVMNPLAGNVISNHLFAFFCVCLSLVACMHAIKGIFSFVIYLLPSSNFLQCRVCNRVTLISTKKIFK